MYQSFNPDHYLKPTLEFKSYNGIKVPVQNGHVYPSFDPQKRLKRSLKGEWKKKRFLSNSATTLSERTPEVIQEIEKDGYHRLDFNDSAWNIHQVPLPENKGTGEESTKGMEQYQDGVWYRKQFELTEEWNEQSIHLKALAISSVADLWINGEYIGHHEGGYTPFAFNISEHLKIGCNTIAIRVDNPAWGTRYDIIPSTVGTDFFNYTGILHDLYLEAVGNVSVARVDLVPQDTNGNVEATVIIENNTNLLQTVEIAFDLYHGDQTKKDWLDSPFASDIKGEEAEFIEEDFITSLTLHANETKALAYKMKVIDAKIWNIRNPHLYVIELAVKGEQNDIYDRFATQFGIRTVRTEGTQILLNEKPTFFAGIARHEEWPVYGRSASWERIRDDFLKINELGVNLVRTVHYPNHIYTYIMLDRLGLVSMSEIPLWQFEKPHYEAQEQKQLHYQMFREMVYSQYNRPSVIMWSTQNESTEVELRKKYNQALVHEARTIHGDGRLITQSAAADQPGYYDESMEPLDVLGWTMYFGIFHGSTPYEGTRNFIEKANHYYPDKPIINTEYGLWSNADDGGMEYQYEVYRDHQLALLEKATVTPSGEYNKDGFIAGMDYWAVFNWYVNHNKFYQTMGMYHMDRNTEKLITQEFIKDHQYILGNHNGVSIIDEVKADRLLVSEQAVLTKKMDYELRGTFNLSTHHYLVIEVFDAKNDDQLKIIFRDKEQEKIYTSYKIRANQKDKIIIPLWKLNTIKLNSIQSIKVTTEQEREVKLFRLTLTNNPID